MSTLALAALLAAPAPASAQLKTVVSLGAMAYAGDPAKGVDYTYFSLNCDGETQCQLDTLRLGACEGKALKGAGDALVFRSVRTSEGLNVSFKNDVIEAVAPPGPKGGQLNATFSHAQPIVKRDPAVILIDKLRGFRAQLVPGTGKPVAFRPLPRTENDVVKMTCPLTFKSSLSGSVEEPAAPEPEPARDAPAEPSAPKPAPAPKAAKPAPKPAGYIVAWNKKTGQYHGMNCSGAARCGGNCEIIPVEDALKKGAAPCPHCGGR